MRIRPRLRQTGAALVSALVVAIGGSSTAWSQSLVEAMAATYNSNPDLLAGRALLRQTDESLQQALSNWRPKVSLSAEFNKIEADSLPISRANTYYILNGKTTLLSVTQPIFRGGKTVADTKAAQANIQAQRAALANTEETVLLQAVISKQGTIENLRLLTGHPMLVPAAIEAVRQWRYRPSLLNGKPIAVQKQITIVFKNP